jgi:hypothetical protein
MNTHSTLDKKFKKLTLSDFDLIADFLKKYPAENVDYNVCTIFTWGLNYDFEYAIHMDRLIILNPEYSYMLAPIGNKLTAEELYQINTCCEKVHSGIQVMAATEEFVTNTQNLEEYFIIKNDIDWNDYVYLIDDMIKLPGKKLSKKKNLISQFTRQNPNYYILPIDNTDKNELINFYHYWELNHGNDDNYLKIEFKAVNFCLENWDLLPANGLKLYVDDKLCAFSIYSPQTSDMATVHFEKYDPLMKGAAQIINYETAKHLRDRFIYVNREQDMGSPGLRQAKR